MSPSVQVTIVDDAKAEKCEGHCGLDFSSPQALEELAELLNKLYGEDVQLEYLDLDEPSTSLSHPEIVERTRTGNLALPLLLINGNLRISGYFDIYLLQNVIQAELEMTWM